VTVVVACLAGALVAVWALRTYGRIEWVEDLELNEVVAGEPQNYLVVGSDHREGLADKRSDTIMVLRIDPGTGETSALSFPRDLQVEIAGTGDTRNINSAYNGEAGIQRLVDTLQQNFAIPIHHYVEIDFAGFKELVEHIGGVPLYFDMAVRNPPPDARGRPDEHDVGLNITELGCVTVDADQALALARSRVLQYRTPDGWKEDLTSDYGRITRQQIVIEQALRKAVQQARANPLQLTGLVELAAGSVTLGRTLDLPALLDLADRFEDFDPDTLRSYSIPISTLDDEGKGDPYPDLVLAEPILNVFRGLPIDEVGPTLVSLTVLNGSGQEGQGANVAGAFQRIGFDVQTPGNAPEPAARTTVHHAPGQVAYGNRVARHLTAGADVRERADLGPGEVVLVTGADFGNVWDQPVPVDRLPPAPAGSGSAGSSGSSTTTSTSVVTSSTSTATTATSVPATERPEATAQVGYPAGQPPPGVTCG
jgi:LCP family protein required for cell wall assembly